ncbi:MAG TPA: quinolinate synthase NadA [Bacillota bacterium]|jgi:quinolinate synthase|nr:quinolinate synthase NadA [Bacillota bacterium]HQE65748.1 quinolinate synthase NadA [Bacillota bacterium]HQI15422.1 quinolinate synthase NadA [Bacillota bacterium]HQJ37538.1 quinolinate synthase NadA [Bacillota bacterium]HQL36198.1 quinolinate synthase NadA [Bacillota bacterium]
MQNNLTEEIQRLKKERNAIILAHNYQVPEVQDVADVVGDSYSLSQHAAETDSDVIVFCGVHFMAESAKILSPNKTVLLPVRDAGCPMADMVTAPKLREMKAKYPDAAVVCYVNSSAEVKAESDVCCTSSNALKVVESLENKQVIFVPDENLGSYVASKVKDKEIILWKGFCITHKRVKVEEVQKIRQLHPNAKILMHPECAPEVQKLADFLGSTSAIINYAREIPEKDIIIGTEEGILHLLKKQNPDKNFYLLSTGLICTNMKKTRLEDVHRALLNMQHEIHVDENIRIKALKSLERMLKIK